MFLDVLMLLVGADSEITWSELPGIAFTEKGKTMADYIDREELLEDLERFAPECRAAFLIIRKQKGVDIAGVEHGRWLSDSVSGKHFCSACDEFALSFRKDRWSVGELYEVFLTDYCPHCGAKMDLEEKHD